MANKSGVRYGREDIDRLVMQTDKHREKLKEVGLIDHAGRLVDPQPQTAPPEPVTHKGYCLHCKKSVDALTDKVEDTKQGASHVSGKCPTCGTGVHTFHKKADGKKLQDALDKNKALTGGSR
jgi:Domain of unknown function (DUF5679)